MCSQKKKKSNVTSLDTLPNDVAFGVSASPARKRSPCPDPVGSLDEQQAYNEKGWFLLISLAL